MNPRINTAMVHTIVEDGRYYGIQGKAIAGKFSSNSVTTNILFYSGAELPSIPIFKTAIYSKL